MVITMNPWANLSDDAKSILEHTYHIYSGRPRRLNLKRNELIEIRIPTCTPVRIVLNSTLFDEIERYLKGSDLEHVDFKQVSPDHIEVFGTKDKF